MPEACIRAYAVVGPTNRNPRRFSSFAIAVDSGVVEGISALVAGRRRRPARGVRPEQFGQPVRQRGRRVRVGDGSQNLRTVTHDRRVVQQALEVGHPRTGPPCRWRSSRRRSGSPRACAGSPSHDRPDWNASRVMRSKSPVVGPDRPTPFGVVVENVVRRGRRPEAAGQPVRADRQVTHGNTPVSTRRANRRRANVRLSFEPGHMTGQATRPAIPAGNWNHSCHTS